MFITLYDENISRKRVLSITDCLESDGILLVPTDTLYAFVCDIHSHKA